MIKVNLAQGLAVSPGGSFGAAEGSDAGKTRRTALRNLVLLILGPLLLILLEEQVVTEKRAALASVRSKLAVSQEKNAKAKGAMEEAKKYREEQARLEVQIQSIETLKKNRRKDVRMMEYIRQTIPNRIWLESMDVRDEKVQIRGFAIADADLTQFMDALSRSAFLKEVNLQRSQDQVSQEFGNIKRFELACLMEFNE